MRILLVEDNADHRELMSLALTGHDPTWQVEEVASGEEALCCLAEEEAYDLVFLDYSLPGRDGLEVLEEIRQGEAPPPVVMVTGLGDEQVAVEAMKGGAYDYVVKGEGYLQRLPVVAQRAVEAHQLAVERKRAEEALRERELKYRTLVEQSIQGLAVVQNGRYVYVNPAYADLTGYSVEDLLSLSQSEVPTLLHPDDWQEIVLRVKDRLAGRTLPPSHEFRFIHKDGSVRWVEGFSSLVDYEGQPAYQLLVVDITERLSAEQAGKRAEEELRRSEKQASAAIEAARGFTFSYDIATGKITWGGAIEEITGYMPEEFAQVDIESWAERIHPEDRDGVLSILQQAIETLDRATAEYRFRKKDGSYVTLASISITERENGKPVRLVGILQDITERKRAEEELQRLYEQAQRDAETKATLLDEVNHRVKNNLLAIVGLLYTEQRYAEMTDQAAYRAITQNLINRVGGLTAVHSLLAASDWAPLPLSDLAGQVIRSSLQILPRHKGVSVDVTPSPVRVTPDQAHSLTLVINELTTNTVKHALRERDTGHIAVRIALEDEDDTVRFEYRDDGPGYAEDVLQLERYSVGFDLIQNTVRTGLRGELSLHNDEGAVAVIRFKAQA